MFIKIYHVKKDFDHKLILFTKTTPKNIQKNCTCIQMSHYLNNYCSVHNKVIIT